VRNTTACKPSRDLSGRPSHIAKELATYGVNAP
jgi:hypothetical protein